MAEIRNQANVTFNYNTTDTGSALSNIALTELLGPLTANKESYQTEYQLKGAIDYVLELTNTGTTALTNIEVEDNLGEYTFPVGSATTVTPLDYVTGSAYYFLDGLFQGAMTVTATAPLTFTLASLASSSTLTIVYKATPSEYARLTTGSSITNTSTFTATNIANPVTATHTLTVDSYADVTIIKAMAPNPVMDNGPITYTFTLSNSGNVPATALQLTDTFTPAPNITTIRVGTNPSTVTTDYTYDSTTGLLTLFGYNAGTAIDLPAATIAQNPTTGEVTVTPSTLVITVSGTI